MVGSTNPPQGPGTPNSDGPQLPTQLPAYKPQFRINIDQWRNYWQKLFKNTQLTDKEVHQMTDQFVNYVWDQMNKVLQHALQTMKELEQKRKEDENS